MFLFGSGCSFVCVLRYCWCTRLLVVRGLVRLCVRLLCGRVGTSFVSVSLCLLLFCVLVVLLGRLLACFCVSVFIRLCVRVLFCVLCCWLARLSVC